MAKASLKRNATQLAEADALARAGKLSHALEVLERARNADPFDARILLELARIAARLSLPEAAERCAAAAQELEPESTEILVERTNALRALSRHDDAIALLRARLREDPPRAELWLALANTVHETGLLGEAETFCARIPAPETVKRGGACELGRPLVRPRRNGSRAQGIR